MIIWVFKIIKFFFTLINKVFVFGFYFFYFKTYPLSENLGRSLFGKKFRISSGHKKRINNVRLKNVIAILYSQMGALVAFFVTLFFGLISISFSMDSKGSGKESQGELSQPNDFLDLLSTWQSQLLLGVLILFFIIFSPIILKKILDHMSPEEYAKATIGNLNQDELLTFLAYKNWCLIDDFLREMKRDEPLQWKDLTEDCKDAKKLESIIKRMDSFLNNDFKNIQQCIVLVRGAHERLGINKRELTNHVLKFSANLLCDNINSVLRNLRTLKYFIEINRNRGIQNFDSVVEYYIKDYFFLINTLFSKRKSSLEELLLFPSIHPYIIGMSSHTSTSLSLKVFMTGISELSLEFSENKANRKGNAYRKNYKLMLKAILRRSKAHCGIDLLLSLENFEKKYLLNGKFRIMGISDALVEMRVENKNYSDDELKIVAEKLMNLRVDYREKIDQAQKNSIFPTFDRYVVDFCNEVTKKGVVGYFIVFGYSELVRQCLRCSAALIEGAKIKVFIMQDDDLRAMDTRTFLFELKKEIEFSITKPDVGLPVKQSFTGKDTLIRNLINKDDMVCFLAGAEVYDEASRKLLHTNRYQTRVENMVNFLKEGRPIDSGQTNGLEVWVVAEKYKVFNNYPNEMKYFGKQFYQDYYETLDVYDLKSLFNGHIKLISD